jgi:hypothetical protein
LILIFIPEGLVVAIQSRWLSKRRYETEEASIEAAKLSVRPVHDYPTLGSEKRRAVPGSGNQAILRVENVSIRFGGLMALGQVSFEMPEGSITALIGPTTGKTPDQRHFGRISASEQQIFSEAERSAAGGRITWLDGAEPHFQVSRLQNDPENVMVPMPNKK